MSFFEIKELPRELLYPPLAQACQIKDVFKEIYDLKTCKVFRTNIERENLIVKVDQDYKCDQLIKVHVTADRDIGRILLENCSVVDRTSPQLESPTNDCGLVPVVFTFENTGGYTRLTVKRRPKKTDVAYELSECLYKKRMLVSCENAYKYATSFLAQYHGLDLSKFTLNLKVTPSFSLDGPSAGAAISLALKKSMIFEDMQSI